MHPFKQCGATDKAKQTGYASLRKKQQVGVFYFLGVHESVRVLSYFIKWRGIWTWMSAGDVDSSWQLVGLKFSQTTRGHPTLCIYDLVFESMWCCNIISISPNAAPKRFSDADTRSCTHEPRAIYKKGAICTIANLAVTSHDVSIWENRFLVVAWANALEASKLWCPRRRQGRVPGGVLIWNKTGTWTFDVGA